MSISWARSIRDALTFEERLSLLAGRDLWHTNAVGRLGVPSLRLSDGPNGARGADGNHGPTSASFPVGSAMGATWDPDLIEEVGRALGREAVGKGAHVLLGPTVNIPRVPVAGRNFECFSEDPLLSGTLAAAWIRGVQDEGVAACIKHFVCNDQETDRHTIDVDVDERALREIYLEPFRIAIEDAGPWALMSAYNTIGGVTASEHPMLDGVLRAEFGFDGLVVSDWYGTYGPGVMMSGLDLEMPGPGRWLAAEAVAAAVEAGEADREAIDRKVSHLLTLIERTGADLRHPGPAVADDRPEIRELARRTAAESIVLLANDGTLPLDRPGRIAVIGELARHTPFQGGGSSSVNPHRVVSILDGITAAAGSASVTWRRGCIVRRTPPPIDPASLDEPGLLVEYFDDDALGGDPVRTVHTARSFLSFFGGGDEWVDHEAFSVRMAGRFRALVDGVHRFSFGAEGRLRVSLDGMPVVDGWSDSPAGPIDVPVELGAGETVDMLVEYGSVPGTDWRFVGIGCELPDDRATIEDAVVAAAEADVAVVVVGLTDEWESEGFDRPDLRLPGDQNALVAAVAAVQPNTVVVVTAGSAVTMPWAEDVAAILHAWYGGQEVGHAVADVLFGDADPGGRLPVTFPLHSRQHPGLLDHPGEAGIVRYGEGVYVGYRGFDRLGLQPGFPFGHGLSYTTFEVAEPSVSFEGGHPVILLTVTNTGARWGSEVVQVYAHGIGGVDRRLAAFRKIRLGPGETGRIRIDVPSTALRWWDPTIGGWRAAAREIGLSIRGTFGRVTLLAAP